MKKGPLERVPLEIREHYKMWAHRPADRVIKRPFFWPISPVFVGHAGRITYTSDKFNKKGEYENYAHNLTFPATEIFAQRPTSPRTAEERWLAKRPFCECPPPPKTPHFTHLGYAQHLEYMHEDADGPEHWEWFGKDRPILGVERSRDNVLFLVWPNDYCWIVTSPVLRVTARGLLH